MYEWRPSKPQEAALRSTAYETLYGGARGGGKTDAGLVWLIKPYLLDNPNARSLVIRKNSDDLSDWIDRANRFYSRYGGVITGKPAIIRFPSGYKIRTGHLKDDQAYTKYQGQEYQRILIEELTQIPFEKHYLQLLGSCRSTLPEVDPRIFATTNPGGVGHGWVKRRFIDPSGWGVVFTGTDTQRSRVFIPAKVEDNPFLMENDPGYVRYLEGLRETDEELYKAWRLGDWDTFAGQFFREFNRARHVVRPFNPRSDLTHISGMDWGRTDPFCFIPAIVQHIKYTGTDKTNPLDTRVRDYNFTRIFAYDEAYGTEKMPREWAEIMNRKADIGKLEWVQCDNMIFNPQNDGSHSIADQFYDYDERFRGKLRMQSQVRLTEGKTQRVNRAENTHQWLSLAPDGYPYLLISEKCTNLIRTLPELVHDELNVEDVAPGEDHAYDALSYMLKAVPWVDAKLGAVNPSAEGTKKLEHFAEKPVPLEEWANI
ncbi:MAG TPA: phage terminase large subunit [Clostridia bacterium]